jgi:hypothetical protein
MRQVLIVSLAVLVGWAVVGCQKPDDESATTKEFRKLYEEYSNRFHEKMVGSAETVTPAQIYAEASRIWDEVFAGHRDVLDARVKEILADLDDAQTLDETQYVKVREGERPEPTEDEAAAMTAKQLFWNPVRTAQMGLSRWLSQLLRREQYALRRLLISNAGLFSRVITDPLNGLNFEKYVSRITDIAYPSQEFEDIYSGYIIFDGELEMRSPDDGTTRPALEI